MLDAGYSMLGIGRWKVYGAGHKAQDYFNSEVGMRMSSHLPSISPSFLCLLSSEL